MSRVKASFSPHCSVPILGKIKKGWVVQLYRARDLLCVGLEMFPRQRNVSAAYRRVWEKGDIVLCINTWRLGEEPPFQPLLCYLNLSFASLL